MCIYKATYKGLRSLMLKKYWLLFTCYNISEEGTTRTVATMATTVLILRGKADAYLTLKRIFLHLNSHIFYSNFLGYMSNSVYETQVCSYL